VGGSPAAQRRWDGAPRAEPGDSAEPGGPRAPSCLPPSRQTAAPDGPGASLQASNTPRLESAGELTGECGRGNVSTAPAGVSALSPLGPQKLQVLGDGAAVGAWPHRGWGVPAHFSSEVRGGEGKTAGPPAATVPCGSSKGQGRGPAGPGRRTGLVLFTSVH